MRKWRVGTISMGLVLIGTGICLFFAKINDQAIFDAVIHWWPLVFILLGLEVLVLSFWGKNNNSLVKYDIFSIFIILLIVFCGLGLYSLEGIGVTGKINDYLTSHEYHIRTSTNEIPVEPEVERLVINAPFCKLKIQTSETNIISSYSYALARADSQEAAKNLADKDTELVSSTSGNTQFISFQLPAAENVQTTEYTIIIPQNIDVELHNSYSVQIYTYELDNNLDFDVALYPYELVTYGETGSVCHNWLQYRLIKKYLEVMTDEQTLVVMSGHPLGLFPSKKEAPRVIITNALMVGMFDNPYDWEIAEEMGVANYGQMTAGGWMYIGPQGIVHGTFNTLVNAGRLKLGVPQDGDLRGHLFVSSGLGGMSGAQPKAVEIANGVGIIAEVDKSRIKTRYDQGWVSMVSDNLEEIFRTAREYKQKKEPISIAYHGNIVDLLEYAVENHIEIDLLSDQTSCHAVYEGGYCPQGVSFEERTRMLTEDRDRFNELVDKSLQRHYYLLKTLVERGTYFFDYGNSFMKAIFDAGVKEISKNGVDEKDGFIWPSYVEDIMGPMLFDYGYGPFRWVCLSGKHEDLVKTDHAAMECIDPDRRGQDRDNYIWIRDAEKNELVVGSQARILYQFQKGQNHFTKSLSGTS
jgi:urocanate hydratase